VLLSAGLVKWEWRTVKGRSVKAYSLVDSKLTVQLDLDAFTRLPSRQELLELLHRYVEASIKRGGLPAKPSVDDVAEVLGVDRRLAVAVVDVALMSEEEMVGHLSSKAMEALQGLDEVDVKELASRLNVHEYWAVRVARKLEEVGAWSFDGRRLRRLSAEEA